jgi:hypothetical protein
LPDITRSDKANRLAERSLDISTAGGLTRGSLRKGVKRPPQGRVAGSDGAGDFDAVAK